MFKALSIPFFIYCKGAYENIRDKDSRLRGQFRALRCWRAGSFAKRCDNASYVKGKFNTFGNQYLVMKLDP